MYKKQQTNELVEYIRVEYSVEPEFLWPEHAPTYAIFRHSSNRKWFAFIGEIPGNSIGLESKDTVEIINLKFDKGQALDFVATNDHVFPAYHMNKNNWITLLLDGTLPNEMIFELIQWSYLLSDK